MKIPLIYPKIPDSTNCPLKKCIVFEKYDGTNIHWKWSQEFGWVSFGTRRDSFSISKNGFNDFEKDHYGLENISELFEKIIEPLGNYLLSCKYSPHKELIIFSEYLGDNSFAGQHIDEPKKLIVLDCLAPSGFMPPGQFGGDFGCGVHLPLEYFPKIIYSGKYSGQLVEDIRKGKYDVKEGAVIKGVHNDKVYMCKVKTDEYLKKLKIEFKDNWKDYWE